jgi:hypothetical protein
MRSAGAGSDKAVGLDIGDVDAADPPVPDSQNGARVGRHDQVNLVRPETGGEQRGLYQFRVVHGQVDPAGPPVLTAVVLDRLPDRWRVDDRQHLAQVVGQQPVKQDLVAVVQRVQGDVTGQVVGAGAGTARKRARPGPPG